MAFSEYMNFNGSKKYRSIGGKNENIDGSRHLILIRKKEMQ
jgi:hypothetical protein